MLIEVLVAPDELIAARLWALGATGIEERTDRLLVGLPDGTHLGELPWPWREIEPVDWVAAQRGAITATSVPPFLIHPPWLPVAPADDEIPLAIDPGPAFGHGGHATTRLALELLRHIPVVDARVLDLGCGTGILAIAAAILGASTVHAIDTDDDARHMTGRNAAANGVDVEIVGRADGLYDLALVNVTIDVHEALRGSFAATATIASGVLDHQFERLVTVYGAHSERRSMDGWTAAIFEDVGSA